jgi:hypothetical protein
MIFNRNALPIAVEMNFYKDHPNVGEAIHYPLQGEDIFYNEMEENKRKEIFTSSNHEWDSVNKLI